VREPLNRKLQEIQKRIRGTASKKASSALTSLASLSPFFYAAALG